MNSFNAMAGSLSFAALAASLGLAAEARADFPVICPSPVVIWGGDAEGITEAVGLRMTSVEPPLDDGLALICAYFAEVGVVSEVRVPDDGSCSGTAQIIGETGVFGRSEVFDSVVFEASARVEGGECVLQVVAPVSVGLSMSTECSSNDDGFSWDCPDGAFQVQRFIP